MHILRYKRFGIVGSIQLSLFCSLLVLIFIDFILYSLVFMNGVVNTGIIFFTTKEFHKTLDFYSLRTFT